jgi:hypothetical protein
MATKLSTVIERKANLNVKKLAVCSLLCGPQQFLTQAALGYGGEKARYTQGLG